MINRAEGLLYIPFTYFKGDVLAATFHMQVFILELLMLWGIPHSTRGHECDTCLFLDFQVHRKSPSDVAEFSRTENPHPPHQVGKQTAPVFINRLKVQEAAHSRSRTHSCFYCQSSRGKAAISYVLLCSDK